MSVLLANDTYIHNFKEIGGNLPASTSKVHNLSDGCGKAFKVGIKEEMECVSGFGI